MPSSILLHNPKIAHNVGAAIRAMSCFGGGNVFWTGDRVDPGAMDRIPREERMKGYHDSPHFHLRHNDGERPISAIDRALKSTPTPVAIELVPGAFPLDLFEHPDNALYIFGPEDGSLPKGLRVQCHHFIIIPSFHCTNLAAAVYLTLYDRMVKRVALGVEERPSLDGESRGWWHSPSLEGVR